MSVVRRRSVSSSVSPACCCWFGLVPPRMAGMDRTGSNLGLLFVWLCDGREMQEVTASGGVGWRAAGVARGASGFQTMVIVNLGRVSTVTEKRPR